MFEHPSTAEYNDLEEEEIEIGRGDHIKEIALAYDKEDEVQTIYFLAFKTASGKEFKFGDVESGEKQAEKIDIRIDEFVLGFSGNVQNKFCGFGLFIAKDIPIVRTEVIGKIVPDEFDPVVYEELERKNVKPARIALWFSEEENCFKRMEVEYYDKREDGTPQQPIEIGWEVDIVESDEVKLVSNVLEVEAVEYIKEISYDLAQGKLESLFILTSQGRQFKSGKAKDSEIYLQKVSFSPDEFLCGFTNFSWNEEDGFTGIEIVIGNANAEYDEYLYDIEEHKIEIDEPEEVLEEIKEESFHQTQQHVEVRLSPLTPGSLPLDRCRGTNTRTGLRLGFGGLQDQHKPLL